MILKDAGGVLLRHSPAHFSPRYYEFPLRELRLPSSSQLHLFGAEAWIAYLVGSKYRFQFPGKCDGRALAPE